MRTDRVMENESVQSLSARTGVPLCMLMRANRLACAAWLTPGREICVPEGDFCKKDAFPCPARLVNNKARSKETEVVIASNGDTIGSIAQALGTTERLVVLARGRSGDVREGERILVRREICKKRIGSVLPGETAEEFCARFGAEKEELLRLNGLRSGRIWPGMRLILPDGGEG